jgi:hypothetical protein
VTACCVKSYALTAAHNLAHGASFVLAQGEFPVAQKIPLLRTDTKSCGVSKRLAEKCVSDSACDSRHGGGLSPAWGLTVKQDPHDRLVAYPPPNVKFDGDWISRIRYRAVACSISILTRLIASTVHGISAFGFWPELLVTRPSCLLEAIRLHDGSHGI